MLGVFSLEVRLDVSALCVRGDGPGERLQVLDLKGQRLRVEGWNIRQSDAVGELPSGRKNNSVMMEVLTKNSADQNFTEQKSVYFWQNRILP